MHQLNAAEIIKHLGLARHPEGGYYREIYRAGESIGKEELPERYTGDRAFSTAIYFMLTDDDISAFHKIRSDETWHYYAGNSLTLYQIDRSGELQTKRLGMNIANGERPQITIEKETYFGARINDGGFCLMGCTVAPGFDFADFEMPSRELLLQKYPQHKEIIKMLT